MAPFPSQPPQEPALQQFSVQPVGLGPTMLPRHRDTRGMDHMRLDATRRKPARQPEAVAAGFEGKCNPRDCTAGLDRLVAPAVQQGKQPFWARLQLLAGLTLNAGDDPPTSQLDWLISTTAMIVLFWSRATRDLLKSGASDMERRGVEFAPDSLLEGGGFKLPVPRCWTGRVKTAAVCGDRGGPDQTRQGHCAHGRTAAARSWTGTGPYQGGANTAAVRPVDASLPPMEIYENLTSAKGCCHVLCPHPCTLRSPSAAGRLDREPKINRTFAFDGSVRQAQSAR